MNKKIVCILFCVILVQVAASAVDVEIENIKTVSNNKSSAKLMDMNKINMEIRAVMTKAISHKEVAKPKENIWRTYPAILDSDIELQKIEISQNPAIISDGRGNLCCYVEGYDPRLNFDRDRYVIGQLYSNLHGLTWSWMYYYYSRGSPKQPRLDFYQGEIAYGTSLPDQSELFGCTYYYVEEDFVNWTQMSTLRALLDCSIHNIGPFTSADVGCYATSNPPNKGFWGVIGLTGDHKDESKDVNESNTILFQYSAEGGYQYIITLTGIEGNCYNVSVDIDQSNGQLYIVTDFVNKDDPSETSILFLGYKITSDESWWQVPFSNMSCMNCSHPQIEACNGRVYITAEFEGENDNNDIICLTTTNPEEVESWESYLVTETSGLDEMYPVITVHSNKSATIAYIANNNLYYQTTKDSGRTWSEPEQVNDQDGTVVEQYGSTDIASRYVVWTDNRNGKNSVYFDLIDLELGEIEIKDLSGGLGVSAEIENLGTEDTANVQWSIDIVGDLILLGEHTEGTISSLSAGNSETVKTQPVFGLGYVIVVVTAGESIKTASGFLIGPFVLGLT